jgi:hypothetical protein
MARGITDVDSNGVLKVGAHSLRMRDVGPDGDPGTADDLLNIAVCQTCHTELTTFDFNSAVTRIKNKLDSLGNLLKVNNHDYLPPFQPGKCATCHRGGTLPFISDTETKTLENAYLNYKLILHDRSFGVHNPGYIERLLDDSIAAISDILKARQKEEKASLSNRHKTEKAEMKAAIGSLVDCGTGWDMDGDCDVDKEDAKLLSLQQKAEKTDLKVRHKAEKTAMKAAL